MTRIWLWAVALAAACLTLGWTLARWVSGDDVVPSKDELRAKKDDLAAKLPSFSRKAPRLTAEDQEALDLGRDMVKAPSGSTINKEVEKDGTTHYWRKAPASA